MAQVLGFLKATYNFFSGDAILLSAAVIAFALCWALTHVAGAPLLLVAVIFIGIIVVGLVTTLSREIKGRPRRR